MKIINLLTGLLLLTDINLFAQDFFIVQNDTTFCKDLNYTTTAQGYLNSIQYTDQRGKKISMIGRENVPDVATFYIKGRLIDKTPLKANVPDGYIRYTVRAVDGKLRVYFVEPGYSSGTGIRYQGVENFTNPNSYWNTSGHTGLYRFYLRMPEGIFYKINSKNNMDKYIKPYLLACTEFQSKYRGDFSTAKEKPFMEMIELYNSLCQ